MINLSDIKDKSVLILEKDGKWISYDKNIEYSDRDQIENYADKNHIVEATPYNIVKKTNSVIIINVSNLWMFTYLPDELTEHQQEQLNNFGELFLDDVKYIEVNTYKEKSKKQVFNSEIKNEFLNIVSNYSNDKNKLLNTK